MPRKVTERLSLQPPLFAKLGLMSRAWGWSSALFIALACSSTTKTDVNPVCRPGESVRCSGPGCEGAQVCNSEGTGFGTCECGGGGGSGGTGASGGGGTTGGSGGAAGSGGSDQSGGTGGAGAVDSGPDAFQCAGTAAEAAQCLADVQDVCATPEGSQCACDSCACEFLTCFQDPNCEAIVRCVVAACGSGGDTTCAFDACGTLISPYPEAASSALGLNGCMQTNGCTCPADAGP
jgi:hypothetical protein